MATTSNHDGEEDDNVNNNDIEVEIEYEFLVPKSLRRGPIKIL
ncbi:10694_t:CDS:2 [Entrophospora sp. SA101]|nr:10694_t:CDS:2 [Entrophospora sp. SA101]